MLYHKRVELTDLLSGNFEINPYSPQAAGLVAWWPTIGPSTGTSVLRDLIRGNNGAITGATWTGTQRGYVPVFAGAGGQGIRPAISALSGLVQFTLSLWVRLDSVSAQDDDLVVHGIHAANQPFVLWRDEASTDSYQFIISDAAGHTTGVTASGTVPVLGWSHLALTFMGDGQTRMYINGREDTASPWTFATVSDVATAGNLCFANQNTGTGKELRGAMSDIRINNIALPPSVIWQMYTEPWDLYMVRRRFWAVKAALAGRVGIYGARPELRIPGGVSIQAVH